MTESETFFSYSLKNSTQKVDQALELLVKYNVPITESLAEKLTPNKRKMSKYQFIFIRFNFKTRFFFESCQRCRLTRLL